MYRKHPLVMLPTNQKANKGYNLFLISNNNLRFQNILEDAEQKEWSSSFKHWRLQHLYILSDEQIKEGDWVFDPIGSRIAQIKQVCLKGENFGAKKIIATTDKSLMYDTGKISSSITCGDIPVYKSLPQIPQSFIEHFVSEYNKERVITEVMVEYEYRHDESVPYPKTLDGEAVLKINPDNTINCLIKPIKDSWSREEVIALLKKGRYTNYDSLSTDKWIEENL